MTHELIRTERDGGVALLVFDRPDKRNALTPDMLAAFTAAAREAARDAGALVLAGNGRAFCAGFDLALCHAAPDGSVMRELLAGLSGAIRALRELPVPVVAAAHGAAIAGGCALLGGADIVVTDRAAKLGYPVLPLGVSPAVSAPFLRLGIGDGPTRARLLDPGLISGERALRLGLAHECVDDSDQVRPRAIELARSLAAKPAPALRATKRWLNELDATAAATADAALQASLSLTGSSEEREALARMFAPRPPR